MFGIYVLPATVVPDSNSDESEDQSVTGIDMYDYVITVEDVTDIPVTLFDMFSFPTSNKTEILNRYDFNIGCKRRPFEETVTGTSTTGYEMATNYLDTTECGNENAAFVNESGFEIIINNDNLVKGNIYNISVCIEDVKYTFLDTVYSYISIYVAAQNSLVIGIDIYGSVRFNKDSKVVLEVNTEIDSLNIGNNNNDDVELYWYEIDDKLSVEENSFITKYKNFLVIDASKDFENVLKENEYYTFEVFAFHKLSCK